MRNLSSVLASAVGVLAFISAVNAGASTFVSPQCAALDKQPTPPQFYGDNPTYTDATDDSESWKVSDPAAAGMNPDALVRAAKTLAGRREQYSMIVALGGKPIFEQYFNGSSKSASNDVHSASKSILSSAIGIAVQEGRIGQGAASRVSTLLPPQYAALLKGQMQNWTLAELMTMTSGLKWTEDTTEYTIQNTEDWVRSILALGLSSPPGATFNYSTGMAHLLSVILTQATGMSTCDYIESRILNVIGAHPTRWDRDPQGYFSGGYNLYLRARDLANFGFLVAAGGAWKGKQVIPREWLASATKAQVTDGDNDGYSYGYDWWLKTISGHSVQIAWGFGGQFIYLVPDLKLMLVMTTNTADYSSDATGESILSDYLIPAIAAAGR